MDTRTWNEWFWLPENYTWKQVEQNIGSDYPNIYQFWKWASIFGAFLLILRNYVIIPFLLEPIGNRVGIRKKPYKHPPPNEVLEDLYQINRARPPSRMLVDAATKIDWSERKVERWLRQKALSFQMTTMDKFCEQGWQAIFYTCFFISGLVVLVPQNYFCDSTKILEKVPFQQTSIVIWWYCAVDCGFYVTQTIILFSQDRRHDFYVMLCHHFISFLINFFCVSMNIMRVLSLSVFIHEIADIPMALAKMCGYSKKVIAGESLGIVFAVVWVCTRLIAYPVMVMWRPLITHPRLSQSWPSSFCLKVCSVILLFLHLVWTIELIQSISRKFTSDQMADARSSPEELSEDEPTINGGKNIEAVKEQVQVKFNFTNSVRTRKEIRTIM